MDIDWNTLRKTVSNITRQTLTWNQRVLVPRHKHETDYIVDGPLHLTHRLQSLGL